MLATTMELEDDEGDDVSEIMQPDMKEPHIHCVFFNLLLCSLQLFCQGRMLILLIPHFSSIFIYTTRTGLMRMPTRLTRMNKWQNSNGRQRPSADV